MRVSGTRAGELLRSTTWWGASSRSRWDGPGVVAESAAAVAFVHHAVLCCTCGATCRGEEQPT